MTDPTVNVDLGTLAAIIFDCDGTLLDSYAAITASVNHVRANYNLHPVAEIEVRKYVGRGPIRLLEQLVPGGQIMKDLEDYKKHHPSVLRSGSHLLPSVAGTLHALSRGGLRLAVCSNKLKAFTLELLEFLELGALFEVVIGPEDAPRLKPAPDMLLAALTQLRIASHEALYVGDMVVDIETARAAGVRVWSIPTGSDTLAALREARPDRILSDFRELANLIEPALSPG